MKLLYALGAICFTRKECAKIQARYLPNFYPKWASGINLTRRPRQFCMGPQSLGGMDVFNIETEQAVQHPTLVVSNL
jgi:hypothetical protein